MFQSALFVVSGVALYGGAHQLYLGIRIQDRHPRFMLAMMFFLLAGFAMSSAAGAGAQSVAQLTLYGKLAVSLGILLYGALPWFIVLCARHKSRVLPALISSAWSVLLLLNLGSASSLLYQDITLLNQALPSGQMFLSLHTSPSPWWRLVEIGMLSTLIFSVFITYQNYQQNRQQQAITLGAGLLVLLCTALADLMINAGLIQSAYLTPMGFFLFLLIVSPFTSKPAEAKPQAQTPAQTSYQLTLNLNQSPATHNIAAPWTQEDREVLHQATHPGEAELTHQQTAPAFQPFEKEITRPALEQATQQPKKLHESRESVTTQEPAPAPEHESGQNKVSAMRIDNPIVDEISDGLVDIAVHATMILKRLQSGQADPEQLEALSRKVRARAIEARRITHRMVRPPQDTESD